MRGSSLLSHARRFEATVSAPKFSASLRVPASSGGRACIVMPPTNSPPSEGQPLPSPLVSTHLHEHACTSTQCPPPHETDS